MSPTSATVTFVIALLAALPTTAAAQTKPVALRTYETRYYVIHTDLGRDAAREAEQRLTRMAEEYHRRTRGFAGEIREKFAFHLFKNESDYHAAGGTVGSAGEYDHKLRTLRVFAGEDGPNLRTWHTVQHEGFHQFAHQVIGEGLPIWVNEGLAEYFAESIFTGDSFVPGIVPQWRLDRVRKTIKADGFMPLIELLGLSHEVWNERLSNANYDQVWSLVHFFVHADDGAQRERFVAFLKDAAGGSGDGLAGRFGPVADIEAKWRAYWIGLPDEPTGGLYAETTVRALTSFLARATARRQRFDSFDAFLAAATKGELKSSASDWLPPSLLNDALKRVADGRERGGAFALVNDPPRTPRIVYTGKSGEKVVGRFTLKGARVDQVEALVPAPAGKASG